ncbi:MAG: hypothetical protein QOF49_75 [Chloroflexota bacterium]|jgi:hypothetical protein|nr:hypothetical protein [Chloroflexota bacterium]
MSKPSSSQPPVALLLPVRITLLDAPQLEAYRDWGQLAPDVIHPAWSVVTDVEAQRDSDGSPIYLRTGNVLVQATTLLNTYQELPGVLRSDVTVAIVVDGPDRGRRFSIAIDSYDDGDGTKPLGAWPDALEALPEGRHIAEDLARQLRAAGHRPPFRRLLSRARRALGIACKSLNGGSI